MGKRMMLENGGSLQVDRHGTDAVIQIHDMEEDVVTVARATPAEWDAFVAAGNAALGRPSTPLADRIASEQTPPVDLSGICSEGREEEVYGLGYARGRADAAAMAREAGSTVPRGAPSPDAEPLFYIWDTRSFVGDSILWWRPNSSGYTINIDEAGTYTAEQCRGNRETDRPVPVEIARAVCSQHVIAPRLRRALEEAALAAPTEGR